MRTRQQNQNQNDPGMQIEKSVTIVKAKKNEPRKTRKSFTSIIPFCVFRAFRGSFSYFDFTKTFILPAV